MIYQTEYYKLVTIDSCFKITVNQLPVDQKLIYIVYEESDINRTNPVIQSFAYSNTSITDCVSVDGNYIIHLQIVPIDAECYEVTDLTLGTDYPFNVFKEARYHFTDVSKDIICDCINCNSKPLSNCDGCQDAIKCTNEFNSFLYIIYYLFLYTAEYNYGSFLEYLHAVFKIFEPKLRSNFSRMFAYGNIRGIYTLEGDAKYIFTTAVYIYMYMLELYKSDYADEINIDYEITRIKNCLTTHNYDYSLFERKVFETNFFGTMLSWKDDCTGTSDCTQLVNNLDESTLNYSKYDFIRGKTITIEDSLSKLVIVIPKVWGLPDEIRDDSNANIISNFNLLDLGGFYTFVSKTNYPSGDYIIKLVYYEV